MTDIAYGSGNVFHDLGVPDPDVHLLKADMAIRLGAAIRRSGATLEEAAARLEIPPRDLALIVRGHFREIGIERLVGLLVGMGVDVSIVVRKPPHGREAGARVVDGADEPEAPVPGLLRYRPQEFDDWGMIRETDGSLFAVVRRPCSQEEMAAHRAAGTDPYEDLARLLIDAEEIRRSAGGASRSRVLAERIVRAVGETGWGDDSDDRDMISKRYGEIRTKCLGGFTEAAFRARVEFVAKLLVGIDPSTDDGS